MNGREAIYFLLFNVFITVIAVLLTRGPERDGLVDSYLRINTIQAYGVVVISWVTYIILLIQDAMA